MAKLLIVHHTPSPTVHEMFESVVDGATDPEIEGVEVVRRAALAATATDVLEADGYLLGTTANLGYMAGALKHFFDQIYYPCLDSTKGRPYGVFIHGNNDTTGAIKGIESIATGLGWVKCTETVTVTGSLDRDDLNACWELGATISANLMT